MKTLILILALFTSTHAFAEGPKVLLHLLDHTDKIETPARFWIDWSRQWRGILASEMVTGAPAIEIVELLRSSLKNTQAKHFCGHDPIYGIVAVDENGLILQTSLCFTCNTWVRPNLRLDIAGQLGSENELCRKLREIIELPDDLRKPPTPKP